MKLKIDAQVILANMPDDQIEVRGMLTQDGGITLFIVGYPREGNYKGKVVIFAVGQGMVDILDPDTEAGASELKLIKALPPMSISMSSLEDAQYEPIQPEEVEEGKIIQLPGKKIIS